LDPFVYLIEVILLRDCYSVMTNRKAACKILARERPLTENAKNSPILGEHDAHQ